MKKNNNVYGVIGIGVKNSNFNAGWDKYPKQNSMGELIASPYALQYCNKVQWQREGKKILGLKTINQEGKCFTIQDKYNSFFEDNKKEEYGITLNNLLSCEDVINYGCAYTGKNSMSIRGVVQTNDAINKYKDTDIMEDVILSPYGSAEGKAMTTNGTRIIVDEAHYIYDFSVFPKEYDKYISDKFEGYMVDNYKTFKEASLISVSNYNSKAKVGCKNEFALFIETNESVGYDLDLTQLSDLIEVYKEDESLKYNLSKLNELLKDVTDKIMSVEVYYNPRTMSLIGWDNYNKSKTIDIITRKELS